MASSPNPERFRFQPEWRITLLALLLLPLLVGLGFWQLARAEEKRELLARYEQQRRAPAQELERLDWQSELAHRPVRLRGRYLNERSLFLDNRVHQGRFGYEIITPFVTEGGTVALVNRGWVAGDPARRSLPAVPAVDGTVELRARVYVPQSGGFDWGAAPEANTGKVRQALVPETLASQFDAPLFPHELRVAADQPGALQPNWVVVNVQPAKHTAYAVQWFAMATALVLLYLHVSSNVFTRWRRRRAQD